MKAIILVAGVGKRLFPLTQKIHKCMIPFNGKPLLQYYLEYLKKLNVSAIALVVGHLRETIEALAGNTTGGIPIRYYQSPDIQGGSLLSLWSAREELDDETLIMDGDVFYQEELLIRLVQSKHPNCFLNDPSSPMTGEEQVLYADEKDRVFHISKKPFHQYRAIGESVGFLKLSKETAPKLKQILEDFKKRGIGGIEHEETYPILMSQNVVGYENVDDLKWTEIDSSEDIKTAEKLAEHGSNADLQR